MRGRLFLETFDEGLGDILIVRVATGISFLAVFIMTPLWILSGQPVPVKPESIREKSRTTQSIRIG